MQREDGGDLSRNVLLSEKFRASVCVCARLCVCVPARVCALVRREAHDMYVCVCVSQCQNVCS